MKQKNSSHSVKKRVSNILALIITAMVVGQSASAFVGLYLNLNGTMSGLTEEASEVYFQGGMNPVLNLQISASGNSFTIDNFPFKIGKLVTVQEEVEIYNQDVSDYEIELNLELDSVSNYDVFEVEIDGYIIVELTQLTGTFTMWSSSMYDIVMRVQVSESVPEFTPLSFSLNFTTIPQGGL